MLPNVSMFVTVKLKTITSYLYAVCRYICDVFRNKLHVFSSVRCVCLTSNVQATSNYIKYCRSLRNTLRHAHWNSYSVRARLTQNPSSVLKGRKIDFVARKILHEESRGECARLRENVPYVKVHRYNPKHLYLKLNGYGDNGERKVWSSCGSTYCTCFACCYPYTVHVRPSVPQPSQAHSASIINRCHSYSEL